MLAGVSYERIDDRGLNIGYGKETRKSRLLEVNNVELCAGQEPLRDLQEPLVRAGMRVHLVGGADVASELDARRAIDQGTRLAARL